MSKKANPTVVGTFVLLGIGLLIAFIIILGKFKFRDDTFRCIAFFSGSLWGLDTDAPVTFRGVTIGRVSQIRIQYETQQQNQHLIPVYIEIKEPPSTQENGNDRLSREQIRQKMEQLVKQGLRAQLKNASLLTGKLYIELAFHPGSELRLHNQDEKLIELPTLPSGLEQITHKLESLPLSDIINKTAAALDGINNILHSEQVGRMLQTLENTLEHMDSLLAHTDAELPGLVSELKKAATQYTTLAETADHLLRSVDKELPKTSEELHQLLASLSTTANGLTRTLANLEQLTAKDSDLSFQLTGSLRAIELAAASVRDLADFLQQHPNALVFGQGEDKQ